MMKPHAVWIFVRAREEACDVYSTTLGLDERYRSDAHGWAGYDIGGACLGVERVMADDADGGSLLGRFVGVSLQADDVRVVYQTLESRGARFTAPSSEQPWGGWLAHFEDPDGNVPILLG